MLERVLPRVYAAILVAEAIVLGWIFTTDPPTSSAGLPIALGWAGLGSMIVMLVYSIARRSAALRRWAALKIWLHLHIFLGLQGVLFVFFHCWTLLFGRTAPVSFGNPAVLNALAVLVVFASGLFGRYLYSLLPRTLRGEQMAAREAEEELRRLDDAALPASVLELGGGAEARKGLADLVRTDLATRARLRELGQLDLAPEVRVLAERRVRLQRRLAALSVAGPWFELWIFLHRPIAAVMYVLSVVHVVLSYMFSPALSGGLTRAPPRHGARWRAC